MAHHHHKAIPFYDYQQVQQVLQLPSLILAMEKAVADFSTGKVNQPVRTTIPVTHHKGFLGVMPAYVSGASTSAAAAADAAAVSPATSVGTSAADTRDEEALGVKLVSFYPENPAGVPTHNAVIALFAPSTGLPLALMDGSLITELRTAAVSAVATRLLSNPAASTLCILGSGSQAHSHWEAVRLVRNFKSVRLWSRTKENAVKFAQHINLPDATFVASSPQEAVTGADVVVCATSAVEPVVFGKYVSKGALVVAVGACRPNWREMDDELMQNATVVVDTRAGAEKESGDVLLSKATVYAELGELVARRNAAKGVLPVSVPLTSPEATLALEHPQNSNSTVVFKSLGMAVEDVVAASLVYKALNA